MDIHGPSSSINAVGVLAAVTSNGWTVVASQHRS